VFDFGALPPEINSGRMYAGPGSEPMMVAATAWDELAAELSTAASGYHSVISELTSSQWVGPTSASMVAAVVPYVTWMSAVASLAEETASQARAAAGAFEAAFALTVPPPVIAANRVLLATLVATNFFGQNTPAIAATEAQYMEMWAQDAAAMYGYAGASATAAQVAPFKSPPNTTTPDGVGAQAAAVSQVSATPAGDTAQTTAQAVSQLVPATSVSQALQQLSSGTVMSLTPQAIQTELQSILPTPANNWLGMVPANYNSLRQTLQAYFGVGVGNFGWSIGQQLTFGPGGSTIGSAGAWYPTPQFSAIGLLPHGGGAIPGMAASAGSAGRVGALAVPPGWVSPVSEVSPAVTGVEAIPAHTVAATAPGNNAVLGGIPAGAAGRRGAGGYVNKYGFRYSVLAHPPSGG
jgi:PPE-repeat protein